MREIHISQITTAVRDLCIKANTHLAEDVLQAFAKAIGQEVSPTGKDILEKLVENARIAREERIPICQDTGFAVVFVEVGQEVRLVGGDLKEANQSRSTTGLRGRISSQERLSSLYPQKHRRQYTYGHSLGHRSR